MDCEDSRPLLADHAAGKLDPVGAAGITTHLRGCADCRHLAAAEDALNAALARLPRAAAPPRLLARLTQLVAAAEDPARAPRGPERSRLAVWLAPFASACVAAALVLAVTRATTPAGAGAPAALVAEAVNDHLRVVASTHPVEIESGGIHQVKPWFTGRLDFAPRVTFSGDGDFPLQGGSVGYFVDRKAAVFQFKRRLHAITLLVFPGDGLAWPSGPATRVGRLAISESVSRGFSVLLWQDGGLGYALVSDLNLRELETLAGKINET
jgi:anti-sigma factor RsiW